MHSVQAELSALYQLLYCGSVLNSPVRAGPCQSIHHCVTTKRIYDPTDTTAPVRDYDSTGPPEGGP